MSCEQVQQHLPSVPDSVRTVVDALCGRRLTMKDLQDESGLARRTVYGALRRLREMGYVEARPNLQDTRQTWFSLRET